MVQFKQKLQKGFTLLVAVITTSLVLAIGVSILNLTLKGFLFANVARDAEVAFYASDALAECALYWDKVANAFAALAPATIYCVAGSTITSSISGGSHTFSIEWGSNPQLSANVSITKVNCGVNCQSTVVRASGFNRGISGQSDARAVERAIKIEY
ncbi:hypothetical protein K2X96_04155 [Patescibacteria group bacterium]|nr:hypothetical protein [Patescibacteria group bacterium]